MVALAAFLAMLLNTLSMIIVLAFTPIAIASLAFPWSKNVFSSWLSICLSNMFTIMFLAIILKGIEGITKMMQGQDMSNRALYAVAMIVLGLTASKFVALAVDLGGKL